MANLFEHYILSKFHMLCLSFCTKCRESCFTNIGISLIYLNTLSKPSQGMEKLVLDSDGRYVRS
jgi:hypothetical protein